MAQRNVLGDEICSVLEDGANNGANQRELEGHLANDSLNPNERKKPAVPPLYLIMTKHTALACFGHTPAPHSRPIPVAPRAAELAK